MITCVSELFPDLCTFINQPQNNNLREISLYIFIITFLTYISAILKTHFLLQGATQNKLDPHALCFNPCYYLSCPFSPPPLITFDLLVWIWQNRGSLGSIQLGGTVQESWFRKMAGKWKRALLLFEGVQFPLGVLHLEVQPAVRSLQTCTQPYNEMFITCAQNLITPKIDAFRWDRWQCLCRNLIHLLRFRKSWSQR